MKDAFSSRGGGGTPLAPWPRVPSLQVSARCMAETLAAHQHHQHHGEDDRAESGERGEDARAWPHKSPSRVRFRAHRTSGRQSRMTESGP
jgi:hypothetical protein